jgi:hypothetical protein
MSEVKIHFVGDSNIDRYLPVVKSVQDDPYMVGATMSKAVNSVQLQQALSTPVELHPVIILAAITNPVTSHLFTDFNTMRAHCNQMFAQIQAWINDGRTAVPGSMQKVYVLFL